MVDPMRLLARPRTARALAAGSLALAASGTVLLRAGMPAIDPDPVPVPQPQPVPLPRPEPATGIQAPDATLEGSRLRARVRLSQGAVPAGRASTIYADVRLQPRQDVAAAPRHTSLVIAIDTSGSMAGAKIAEARRAILTMVDRLNDGDSLGIVAYSDHVKWMQPMAPVSQLRGTLRQTIWQLSAGGATDIAAGMRGAWSVMNNAAANDARRVVLVSDGRDTTGHSWQDVATLAAGMARSSVTVSALGVGVDYDEATLTRTADAGHGNYAFLQDATSLDSFLAREAEQTARVSIERAVVELRLPAGWSLRRAYGVDAEVQHDLLRLPFGALAAGAERRATLELSVDAGAPGDAGSLLASAEYMDGPTGRIEHLGAASLALRAVSDPALAQSSTNDAVTLDATSMTAAARQQDAIQAWRRGEVEEARRLTQANVVALREAAARVRPQYQAAASASLATNRAQSRAYEQLDTALPAASPAAPAGAALGLQQFARDREAQRGAGAY